MWFDGESDELPEHIPHPAPEPPEAEAYGGNNERAQAVDEAELQARIISALKNVCDPEIPLNIYDLGLIYGVEIDGVGNVEVTMTLTSPGCPVAGALVQQVADVVGGINGVARSHVTLTWDPPWSDELLTDEAKLELGLL